MSDYIIPSSRCYYIETRPASAKGIIKASIKKTLARDKTTG